MRILVVSTPVGPLGSGIGGGVELTLHSLVLGLTARGHDVEVAAPAGSLLVGRRTHQIAGTLQPSSQHAGRDAPVELPAGLGARRAVDVRPPTTRTEFDVIVNLAFDWLPIYLTRFLQVPVAHLVSMASINDSVDAALADALAARPGCVAMHSEAQAATFPTIAEQVRIVGNGIAVERYDVRPTADSPPTLGYVGRIAPEKGIDDVFAVAAATRLPVRAWGVMQDRACWDAAVAAHPTADVRHEGFLATDDLQAAIGGCAAVLMTPRWVEAFGNVAVEAMACGVPVLAYRRGGPAEIVVDGVTGFLVEPDDTAAMVAAVGRVGELDRRACRREVEQRWSVDAVAARVDEWLTALVAAAVGVAGHA